MTSLDAYGKVNREQLRNLVRVAENAERYDGKLTSRRDYPILSNFSKIISRMHFMCDPISRTLSLVPSCLSFTRHSSFTRYFFIVIHFAYGTSHEFHKHSSPIDFDITIFTRTLQLCSFHTVSSMQLSHELISHMIFRICLHAIYSNSTFTRGQYHERLSHGCVDGTVTISSVCGLFCNAFTQVHEFTVITTL
jgi:hypothetical protein